MVGDTLKIIVDEDVREVDPVSDKPLGRNLILTSRM